jgi:hypothetical protein
MQQLEAGRFEGFTQGLRLVSFFVVLPIHEKRELQTTIKSWAVTIIKSFHLTTRNCTMVLLDKGVQIEWLGWQGVFWGG